MKEQMWLGSPSFPLSLNELEGLPSEEFERVATDAGVSAERLREIVKKARERKAAEEDGRRRALSAEIQLCSEYPYVSSALAQLLKGMVASEERLDEAEQLELQAFRLFEGDLKREAHQKFCQSQDIHVRDRLSKLCREFPLGKAFLKLKTEKREAARTSNVPNYRKVINACLASVKNELDEFTYRTRPAAPDAYGPAQKFSVEQPLNYPRNPRPRRYNDELKHF